MITTANTKLGTEIARAFSAPATVQDALGTAELPQDVAKWLGRLHTLVGVPFHYLVPDEGMLPPESIRFFRLDGAWVKALIDGAFSLGRNLTAEASASTTLDAAVLGDVLGQSQDLAPLRPRRAATLAPMKAQAAPPIWNGFIMRSRLVTDYPGLGVNVYPKGHTPTDKQPILLPVRRLDRLGETSDTILCLVEGEAFHVDIHEAPEALHYGIDTYSQVPGAQPVATKFLRRFEIKPGGEIVWCSDQPKEPVQIGGTFRTASPRVMKMTEMAKIVGTANDRPPVNSAEMGFEMTQGVGKVTFINRDVS
ncbi:hypothetical protein [Gymnodinialimonas sp.]